MARSKSITGGKTSRVTKTKEPAVTGNLISGNQIKGNPAESTEAKASATEIPGQQREQERSPVRETQAAAASIPHQPSIAKETNVEPRKLEMVRNESRKNLFPINLEDEIRLRAFEIYQQRGSGGSEAEDWLTAEREILQRYRKQSA
jgi:hypothetical protein